MVSFSTHNSKNGSESRSCHHLRRIRAFSGSLSLYHFAVEMSTPVLRAPEPKRKTPRFLNEQPKTNLPR